MIGTCGRLVAEVLPDGEARLALPLPQHVLHTYFPPAGQACCSMA